MLQLFTGERVSADRWKFVLFCFFLYILQLKSRLDLSFCVTFAYLIVLRQLALICHSLSKTRVILLTQ